MEVRTGSGLHQWNEQHFDFQGIWVSLDSIPRAPLQSYKSSAVNVYNPVPLVTSLLLLPRPAALYDALLLAVPD